MPSISLIRLCVATMFMALAAASARAVEPVWQLVVKRMPVPSIATSTAKAVPATQPSSETPTLTARISFVPNTPVDAEIQMNSKTFHLSALVTQSHGGHFRIKIDVGITESGRIEPESHEVTTAPATQKSSTLDQFVRDMQTSDDIKAITRTISIERVSTTASLREGEEHSLGGDSDSQWLIKIEKKPAQK